MVKTPRGFKVPTRLPMTPQKRHRPPSVSGPSMFSKVYLATPPAPVSPCTILGLKPSKKKLKFGAQRHKLGQENRAGFMKDKIAGRMFFNLKFPEVAQSTTAKGEMIMAFDSSTPKAQRNVLAVKTNTGIRLPTPPPWKKLNSSTPVSVGFTSFIGVKTEQCPAPKFNFSGMDHDDSDAFQAVDANNNDPV